MYENLIYWTIFIIFVIIVAFIVFVIWYYLVHINTDMASVANASGFIPYPYDRKKCCELIQRPCEKKYKIAIVCLSVGNRKFAQITREFLTKYCNTHGYDLHYFTEPLDPRYKTIWQKILAFNKVLLTNKYDYVVWYDDDILIKNMDIKMEQFIALSDKPIILSRDLPKKYYSIYINSGCFICKNCDISKKLLRDWIDGYDNLFGGKFQTQHHHDQSILIYLYFKKYHPYADCIPHGVMQTIYGRYDTWDGEFAVHLSGLMSKPRNRLAEEYKSKLLKN